MRFRIRGIRCQVAFFVVLMGLVSVYFILFESSTLPDPSSVYFSKDELEKLILNKNIFHNVTYKSPFEAVYKNIMERQANNKSMWQMLHPTESPVVREEKYRKVWQWANDSISQEGLFPGDAPQADLVLKALATARIVSVGGLDMSEYESGTSVKWIAQLEGGQKAVIKLVWEKDEWSFSKAKNVIDGQLQSPCNAGHEMCFSEIAGWHLHRVLGFYNTPYVSGRQLSLIEEIYPVANEAVRKQISILPGGDACITAKCYLCKYPQRLCVSRGMIDASIAYWIPRPLKLYTYPPGYMPYSTPRMDRWEHIGFNNKTYCKELRQTIEPYEKQRYYNDLFDFAVLDTLMYHYDSKHYVVDDNSKARGLTIRLDHGRAFCFFDEDNAEIFLAPITQCCSLRKTTYSRLQELRYGDRLTSRLRSALEKDPLYPVLSEVWYPTLERRLKLIFAMLEKCIDANGLNNVMLKV